MDRRRRHRPPRRRLHHQQQQPHHPDEEESCSSRAPSSFFLPASNNRSRRKRRPTRTPRRTTTAPPVVPIVSCSSNRTIITAALEVARIIAVAAMLLSLAAAEAATIGRLGGSSCRSSVLASAFQQHRRRQLYHPPPSQQSAARTAAAQQFFSSRRRSASSSPMIVQQQSTRIQQQQQQQRHSKIHQRLFSSSSSSYDYDPLLNKYDLDRHTDSDDDDPSIFSGYARPTVQWYPGHIAKAERQLQETVRAVDVVVEVRDARIPQATAHPQTAVWCAGKPRIVVLTHEDAVPAAARTAWRRSYRRFGAEHPRQALAVNKQIQHQAAQAHRERLRYRTAIPKGGAPHNRRSNRGYLKSPGATNYNRHRSVVAPVEDVIFVNAKEGRGVFSLVRSIIAAGEHVQERRLRRGLQGRPLRVGILGYPNVGKSALINRLLGRRRAKTANTPGVTRSLQWIRVRTHSDTSQKLKKKSDFAKRKEFELLDSPGIIPAVLEDQSDALLLAACNCIGEAAYDNQSAAAYLCEWMLQIHRLGYEAQTAPQWRQQCLARYFFDPIEVESSVDDSGTPFTGEDMLFKVADNTCKGDPEDAARKILQDFRKGFMGPACLQVAPRATAHEKDPVSAAVAASSSGRGGGAAMPEEERERYRAALREERRQHAARALETAKERGLELPPSVVVQNSKKSTDGNDNNATPSGETTIDPSSVGKGQFDGW